MRIVPFIPESAPFDPEQRLWLNGYMAGLFASKGYVHISETGAPKNDSITARVPLLILFGSQTGTAEKLAKEIAKESKSRGCLPRVVEATEHSKIDWSREVNLLVVTSTYGDGDMPDNAQGFWDWLQTEAANSLAHLNFSVLALGDTNYEQFCAAGKKIDARLEQLGAKRIHPLADCDLDYEAKMKSWQDGALVAIAPAGNPAPSRQSAEEKSPGGSAPLRESYSKSNPFPARLLANRKLNADGSEKETRHFEISLTGSDLNYEAGDALGVFPVNCSALVEDLLAMLGCSGDEIVAVSGGEWPFRKVLANTFDITRPSPELLQRVGERNAVLRELLVPERKDELRKWLWGREVVDLLLAAPDLKFSPGEFLPLLKKLAPRLYSISSSPKAHAGQVHLTINIMRYQSHGRARKGVASTFLADRVNGETPVPVFVQTSHGFRLPANGDTPVIMIGPGTGVAPFRAFLHERRVVAAKGRNWLFFGEQRAANDFYYRDELEKMFTDGHLTKLSTAFSRDQAEKIYVQNRMLENAAEIWSWLEAGAHLYVCGDASRMAKDVDATLHKIVETAGGRSADDAKNYVARLKTEKRYQRDVY
jgi:sulfite reductase (NADPH) flavoprotein alpha-component